MYVGWMDGWAKDKVGGGSVWKARLGAFSNLVQQSGGGASGGSRVAEWIVSQNKWWWDEILGSIYLWWEVMTWLDLTWLHFFTHFAGLPKMNIRMDEMYHVAMCHVYILLLFPSPFSYPSHPSVHPSIKPIKLYQTDALIYQLPYSHIHKTQKEEGRTLW